MVMVVVMVMVKFIGILQSWLRSWSWSWSYCMIMVLVMVLGMVMAIRIIHGHVFSRRTLQSRLWSWP